MKTTKEIKEINDQITILYAKKELLESEQKAATSKSLFGLFPKCEFWITDHFGVQLYGKNKEFEDELWKLTSIIGDGWNHFEMPISKQIKLRGDDGTFVIQFCPANIDKESSEKEWDNKYQFERVVEFLKSKGVKQEQISVARLKENIKQANKNLADAITDLKFVEETLAK